MILDALTHVTPDATWFNTGKDAGEARLLREMDAAGIDRAVVVAIAGAIPNEFVHDLAWRHPRRIIGGGSFNPAVHATPAAAAEAIRRELGQHAFPILKLHPRIGKFDPLDPRVFAVLEEVASWNPPPLIWMCSLIHGSVPLRKGVVESMHEVVVSFPTLRFLLLHGGGTMILELAEAVRPLENAMIDLALTFYRYAATSVAADLHFLVENFNRRTVFGSDFPEIGLPEGVRMAEALLRDAPLGARDRIMGGNLERLLEGAA